MILPNSSWLAPRGAAAGSLKRRHGKSQSTTALQPKSHQGDKPSQTQSGSCLAHLEASGVSFHRSTDGVKQLRGLVERHVLNRLRSPTTTKDIRVKVPRHNPEICGVLYVKGSISTRCRVLLPVLKVS